MDRRATFALAFVLLAAVFTLGTVTWSTAQVGSGNDLPGFSQAGNNPELLGALAPSKRPDGYPSRIGPAVIDAVLNTGAAGTADDILWLIFNQDISAPGIFQSDDILFTIGGSDTTVGGLTFAYHSANAAPPGPNIGLYANVIAVQGLDNLPVGLTAGDVVGIRNPQRPGLGMRDASRIVIETGPAITKVVQVGGSLNPSDNSGDLVRVFTTHELQASGGLASGADARQFFNAPELGTAGVNPTISGFSAGDYHATVAFNDNFDQGKWRNAISAMRFAGANVVTGRRAGFGTNELNAGMQWVCSLHFGPALLRAGYNPSTNALTLAFSDDIRTGQILAPGTTQMSINGGAITYAALDSDDGDNVLVLTGLSGNPVGTSVTPALGNDIQDFQGNPTFGGGVTVVQSPIIVRSNWRDGGTDALTDDRVNVWFDTNFQTGQISVANLNFVGMSIAGSSVLVPALGQQVSVTDLSELWTQGDRVHLVGNVNIDPDNAPANATPDSSFAYIRDGAKPRTVGLAPNGAFTADINDTAYVAFDEVGVAGGDDSGYILFYSRKNIPVDATYVLDFIDSVDVVTDPSPGIIGAPEDLNSPIIGTLPINVGAFDTEGSPLAQGDDVYFAGVLVDKEGNWDANDIFPVGQLVAGPLACPRDTLLGADNLIQIFGVDPSSEGPYGLLHQHYICGAAGSAPPDADSVRVYADTLGGGGMLGTVLLGSAVANPDGSWGPIALEPAEGAANLPVYYLVSVQNTGASAIESATYCPIINDVEFPEIESAFDPVNAALCYSGGDTLRILVDTQDNYIDGDGVLTPAENNLLYVWADLSELVTTAGADSVVLVSLGANQVDDDNDWDDTSSDPLFDNNDRRDWPEPYIDENGDGMYTPGEFFVDLNNPDHTDGVYDVGDANLDSNDPDENGYYYLPGYYLDPADLVADPNGISNFAVLEDLPVILNVEDNGALSNLADNVSNGGDFDDMMEALSGGQSNFVSAFDATCPSASLEHRIVDNTSMLVTEDSQAPTVSEISYLERRPTAFAASGNPNSNIILPGNHCYTLAAGEAGHWFNLVDSTLSDDEVTMVALQIDAGGGWGYLDFDPAGDANGDGAPGILDEDDDGDGGIDLEDTQVRNASQDSTADANAENDGIYIITDNYDNDRDAFFRFNPIYGNYVWFNIDERTDNQIDDDGNGTIDDGGEVETYTAANDDDEDGIEGRLRCCDCPRCGSAH